MDFSLLFEDMGEYMRLVECQVCGKRGISCADRLYVWCRYPVERKCIEINFKWEIKNRFPYGSILNLIDSWLDREIDTEELKCGLQSYPETIKLCPTDKQFENV
jgi:hypothetical protein